MEVIAQYHPPCPGAASWPRRVLARGATLGFLAGALFVLGLLFSQPAHAAVADSPGARDATSAGTGAVAAATGTAAGPLGQAATSVTQAVSQAADQVPGLATSTATQASAAPSTPASTAGAGLGGTAGTGAGGAGGSLGSAAGTAVSQATAAGAGAVSQVTAAAGQAAGAATQALSGVTGTVSGTAPGGGTEPSPGHHRGHSPHKHRRGHPRHRHGSPGDHPGRPGHPAPGLAGRPVPVPVNAQFAAAPAAARHGIARINGRRLPASPAPVLPALPELPTTGSAPGSGTDAHGPGHATAGLLARTTVAPRAATRLATGHRQDWIALIRDGRGPHRPG